MNELVLITGEIRELDVYQNKDLKFLLDKTQSEIHTLRNQKKQDNNSRLQMERHLLNFKHILNETKLRLMVLPDFKRKRF